MSALPASRPMTSFPIAVRPRIAAHVIAAFFPETCFVFAETAHALDPLRGSPCVELRNDQTQRRAMRVEHRPLLSARLTRRNAILAPRVRTDDHFRLAKRFGFARIVCLIFGIFD